MPDKSYVTMEQHICLVCGAVFDTGNILLHRNLREVFDRYTVTGRSLCPECLKRREEGYVFFVECTQPYASVESLAPEQATPTGNYARVRKHVADMLFPEKSLDFMAYVAPDVFQWLKDQAGRLTSEEPANTQQQSEE